MRDEADGDPEPPTGDDRVGEPCLQSFVLAGGPILVQSATCRHSSSSAYSECGDPCVMKKEIGRDSVGNAGSGLKTYRG